MYHHFRAITRTGCVASLLLLGAAGPHLLHAQDEDEREAPEVKRVTFRGVHNVDGGELRESIATKPSRCKSFLARAFCLFTKSRLFYERHYFDSTEFRRDALRIRVFYWRLGYRDARVDTTVARVGGENNVAVTFRILEGPPTRVSSIIIQNVGDSAVLSDREIARHMQLRAGRPLNLPELDSSVVLLRNALFEKGFADAEVRRDTVIVDTVLKAAAVRLTMDPKWRTRVGRIQISGEEKIKESTIRRSLTMKEGGVYKRSDILTSQRNLYESNLFRRAAIVIPPQGDSIKLIDVSVREAALREVRTSVGFNTIDFFQAEQRFTRYNFLGGARRLDLRGVAGNLLAEQLNGAFPFKDVFKPVNRRLPEAERRPFLRPTWQLSADFTQPWVWSSRNSTGLGLFAHRRTLPAIVIDRGYGASAAFTRQLAPRSPASLSYRFEVTEVEAGDVYFCQNFGVCALETIGALRGRHNLSPVSLSLLTDRTNSLFYPTAGLQGRIDLEHASTYTLSDFRYNRIAAEASKYWRVRHQGALAARVRTGWVRALASTAGATRAPGTDVDRVGSEQILHPRKGFYSGGSQSVRGYGENQLGPRVLTIDPAKLPEGAIGTCSNTTDAGVRACRAVLDSVSSNEFQPRPTGGRALLEGNLELRFPVWGKLGGAVFVDGAFVGRGTLGSVTRSTGALTPGFGARYYSPAGAIRVDLGIRPQIAERLPVVTQVTDSTTSQTRIVRLSGTKNYDPLEVRGGFFGQILNRLQLHLSIGQAF